MLDPFSVSLASGNAIVFIQILEYFLKTYSQILADFFKAQAINMNGGVDVLS